MREAYRAERGGPPDGGPPEERLAALQAALAAVQAALAATRAEADQIRAANRAGAGERQRLALRVQELNTALRAKQEEFLDMLDRLQEREEEAVRRALRELSRSEERFRLVVGSVTDYAIFLLDPEGRITSWNEGAARITGYDEREVLGQSLDLFVPSAPLLHAEQVLRVAAREGRANEEGWRVRKDGGLFWASEIVTPLRDERGQVAGFVTITRDLTERMEQQRRLEETAAELEATVDALQFRTAEAETAREAALVANRAKSEFLAVMSHELRTPLNAVLGYADLLDLEISGPVNPAQREKLRRIRASARHLLDIIDEILNFSRVEAGREEVRAEPVELSALARDVAAMSESLAIAKGLRLRVRTPDAPVTAHTDPGKARQILLNLLSNAVKFTDEGEVDLELDVADGAARFRVRDTGIGIAAENLERVFDPFWQVEQSSTRRVGGTGLGLSVSRQLAVLLGGSLTVQSARGAGTTFTFALPL